MTQIPESLQALAIDIDSITTWPRNYNNGDVEAIKESLARSGQYRPIVVWRRTMQILAGNHTYMAAVELGWKQIAATFVDGDDETATRIGIADNRIPQLARPDNGLLLELLQELPDLDGTGYNEESLNDLIERANDESPLDEEKKSGIKYVLNFDNLDQKARWFQFIKALRRLYPDRKSVAARIDVAIEEVLSA
jgi:ParB-like chromosome segregation protein Spo0J